jgi:hypothetical protein
MTRIPDVSLDMLGTTRLEEKPISSCLDTSSPMPVMIASAPPDLPQSAFKFYAQKKQIGRS